MMSLIKTSLLKYWLILNDKCVVCVWIRTNWVYIVFVTYFGNVWMKGCIALLWIRVTVSLTSISGGCLTSGLERPFWTALSCGSDVCAFAVVASSTTWNQIDAVGMYYVMIRFAVLCNDLEAHWCFWCLYMRSGGLLHDLKPNRCCRNVLRHDKICRFMQWFGSTLVFLMFVHAQWWPPPRPETK